MRDRAIGHRLILALALGVFMGVAGRTVGDPPVPKPAGAKAAEEDPAVTAYFKKKGWWFIRDIRIVDHRPIVILTVEDREKPFENITISADDYKMIARSKTVQMLDLRKVKNNDEGIKAVAGIPQLQAIMIDGDDVTNAGIAALAKCRSLETVMLLTKNINDAGLKELAALPKLRWLYCSFMNLDGSAFAAFAGSKTLESVTLEYVDGFTDDGAKHLAKLSKLNELKIRAGFGEKKLTTAGIKAIAAERVPARFEFDRSLLDDSLFEMLVAKGWLYGPTPSGVSEKKPATPLEVSFINLEGSQVTDKGFQAVLNCTNAKSLYLRRSGVTDETFKKLTTFKKLEYISLEKSKVTAAGLDAISDLPIRHIAMEDSELSEDCFKAFGKMTRLEELWLGESKMQADWLRHIAGLSKLKDLNLRHADFDDAATSHLAGLKSLQSLTLNDTRLGDAGFLELLKLPKLKSLFVDGTRVTKEVYKKAKREHPGITMYHYRYDP